MGKFTLTDDAKWDMKEVKEASLKTWNAAMTKVYLAGLLAAMNMLADHQVGNDASEHTWPGVLNWPCGSHYIYFVRIQEGIIVVGIIHQSRLPQAVKKREP